MAGRDVKLLLVLVTGALAATPALADPTGPDGSYADNERLRPGIYPSAPMPEGFSVPEEPGHPPFDIDWSVGLRGTLTSSTTGNSFVTTLNPRFTATHDGQRTDLVIEGSAEIARPWDGEIDFSSLRLGLTSTTAIDSTTNFTGNAALSLNQQLPTTPGLDPLIALAPEVASGSVSLGVDRRFGRFNLGVNGSAERVVYGPTLRRDTGLTGNGEQNVWTSDASLRLGWQATPIIEVFTEASAGRDWFDHNSPALGVSTNATSTALRGGLSGRWNSLLTATASVGVGHHDFDDGSLADITTQLYDASVTFTPDPTLNLVARLSTNIAPTGADATGTARVEHLATASVDYTVNSWLRLRASADWGQAVLTGGGETEQRRGIGAGADYRFNAHTALSADYGYAYRDNSARGVTDTHTVGVGITIRR